MILTDKTALQSALEGHDDIEAYIRQIESQVQSMRDDPAQEGFQITIPVTNIQTALTVLEEARELTDG